MTEKNKDLNEDILDLMIRRSIEEISEEELKNYEEIAESIEEIPTPKLDEAMRRKKQKRIGKKILHIGAIAAVLCLVLFGTHMMLYSNVEAYRFQFQRMFVQYDTGAGGFGSLSVTDNEKESGVVHSVAPVEDYPFLFWIPDGYVITMVTPFDVYTGICEFENEKGEKITFIYYLHENNTYGLENNPVSGFDTEDSEVEEIFIHGNDGIALARRDFGRVLYSVLWTDENYVFDFHGNFEEKTPKTKELIAKMAKSLVYQKK